MHYLVQKSLFTNRNFNLILEQLEKMGASFDVVSILPYTNTIQTVIDSEDGHIDMSEFETDKKNIFCYGEVKFAHIAKDKNWYPGSLFNDNHDFEVYSKYYKEHLLNYPYKMQKLDEPIPDDVSILFFARPCRDTKLFTGGVFMRDSWNEMVDGIRGSEFHLIANVLEEKVMFSDLKEIAYETRCWVVDGKVITMSEYRRGRHTIYQNVDDNTYLKEQVQKLVDIYQPAEAFVMDVCETVDKPGEVKIVEINCINCSGFYLGDMQRVINALEEKFNEN